MELEHLEIYGLQRQKRRPLKSSAGGGLSSPGREIVKSRYEYVCMRHAKVQRAMTRTVAEGN